MNVYLFFNNPCKLPPEGDKWNNWQDPDTTKLAWVCGESWRRHGWNVKRLGPPLETFEPFTGRLTESVKVYPFEYWQFWFQALRVCKVYGETWFTTIDVINFGFTPEMCLRPTPADILTVQSQHFSASCLRLTEQGCKQAIDLIRRYDAGEFPTIACDLVSDETIIRNYGTYGNLQACAYSVEGGMYKYPLVHVPKSSLGRLFDSDAYGAINQ